MGSTVMRRRTIFAFCWIAIFGLGAGVVVAVGRVSSMHGFRAGWQGIPVYMALVAILARIANPKIVLGSHALWVVNPLRTYFIPREAIEDVSVDEGGTLEIHLAKGENVSVFAYSGSLVDHFFGTSDEASRRVKCWMDSKHRSGCDAISVRRCWTRCNPADIAAVLCIAISAIGGAWMVIGAT